jgi:hypothetical protein
MSITYKIVVKEYEEKVIESITCNKCGKVIENTIDNILEFQEVFKYRMTGGYGSVGEILILWKLNYVKNALMNCSLLMLK